MTTDATATEPACWTRLRDLPLHIESARFEQLSLEGATSFTRLTTEVWLEGGGHTGRGEDPAYSPDSQKQLPAHFATLDLTGEWTLDSFSRHLDGLPLTPAGGVWDDHANFHRWAFESAALDLALRQADRSFADAVGRTQGELTFCVSMGLGSPPDAGKVLRWLEARPDLTFKLDASREWDDQLAETLAATGAVRVVDIKGMYTGDWIDNTPDPELYARIAQLLPDVLIEDPKLLDETRAALGESGLARVTWDAPLHSLSDLTDGVDHPPVAVNIKPSRFGTTRELLAVIDWCEQRGVPLYAGGQYELGYGRTQAQTIAATFYPSAANDIAPAAWHTASPGDDVPSSPLALPVGPGFGFEV